tara:strand:+ start:98 stop:316 length:219 start_codon:yes stop_codon:yes gene_type:complete
MTMRPTTVKKAVRPGMTARPGMKKPSRKPPKMGQIKPAMKKAVRPGAGAVKKPNRPARPFARPVGIGRNRRR